MHKHCSDVCKLRPCLNKESKNSARLRTVTAALQRQYSQTELTLWIPLVHAYIHTCMHACIYTYKLHTHVHATYIHTHTYKHACMHTYIHIHTYTHTCIYTYIYTHTYIYTYTHTHTYIHTYIQWMNQDEQQ